MTASKVQMGLLIIGILTVLGSSAEILVKIGAGQQQTIDAVAALETRESAREIAEDQKADRIAADLVAGRKSRDEEIARNERKRDDSDRALKDAIDRLTDRVNRLTDALAVRLPHSELWAPLPGIGKVAETEPWGPPR